ncbi:MAG: hypothetical protein ABSE45_07370 [Candidatus Acidiferrales bacterium]|jgi:hypothetical protein
MEVSTYRPETKKIISIPATSTVLVVEDKIDRRAWFVSRYRVPRALLASTAVEANRTLSQFLIDVVFLDYDGEKPGETFEPVARYLSTTNYRGKIFIHSLNTFGAQVLKRILPSAALVPFGDFEIVSVRGEKIVNRDRV